MKRAALLLLLGGCNQVWGLDGTKPAPDASPFDAPLPRVKLTYVAATTSTTSAVPTPELVLATPPVTPAPEVRVGPLDGALVSRAYSAGEIEIPTRIFELPQWRLEYTVPGDVPREVQWHPTDTGHIAVPMIGRVSPRDAIPTGSSYGVTTSHAYSDAHVYTTGVWNELKIGGSADPVFVGGSQLQSMFGKLGAPDPAQNDFIVVADYASTGNCSRLLQGAGVAKVAALAQGQQALITATYASDLSETTTVSYAKASAGKLDTALDTRIDSPVKKAARTVVGRLPERGLSSFISTYNGVPAPPMVVVADCAFNGTVNPDVAGRVLTAFPKAVMMYASNLRQRGATELLSSLVSVAVDQATFQPTFEVPLALTAKLADSSTSYPLEGATDMIQLPPSIGRIELSFTHDAFTPDLYFDYFEVWLYSINQAIQTPKLERIYIGTNPMSPKITIDPNVLELNIEYAIAIKTYRGAPQVPAKHDFATAQSDLQSVGTIFFRTFVKK